jgi:hypothetical protein
MNKFYQSQQWSAALIALLLTGAMNIMMLTMLERIIPASRNTKWIENSANATYVALSWIEQSLMGLNINNPGHWKTGTANSNTWITDDAGKTIWTGSIKETANMIPLPGKWNKIAPGKPVQIFLTRDFISNTNNLQDVKLDLRIPQLGSTGSLAGSTSDTQFIQSFTGTIVNLAISNANKTLVPNYKCTGSETWICNGVRVSYINSSTGVALGDIQAQVLENSKLIGNAKIQDLIYAASSPGVNGRLSCQNGCMLKLFIVNKIISQTGNKLPYLEYRIRKNDTASEARPECMTRYSPNNYLNNCVSGMSFSWNGIPLQYAQIEWIGRIWPFEQRFTREIQQITTGDAFDFTVIQ